MLFVVCTVVCVVCYDVCVFPCFCCAAFGEASRQCSFDCGYVVVIVHLFAIYWFIAFTHLFHVYVYFVWLPLFGSGPRWLRGLSGALGGSLGVTYIPDPPIQVHPFWGDGEGMG